jgi:hypothetical protein
MEGIRKVGDRVATGLSLGVAALGLLAIAGWQLHLQDMLLLLPDTPAMQYNTALVFVVLGATSAWLAHGGQPRWPVIAGATFVLAMGLAVVVEHVANVDLGVDTLLFEPWDQTQIVSPGRMSLIAATGFSLAGAGLLYRTVRRDRDWILGVFAAPPGALAISSLLGHLVGVRSLDLPLIQPSAQMAIATSLALILWSLAMFRLAFRLQPDHACLVSVCNEVWLT